MAIKSYLNGINGLISGEGFEEKEIYALYGEANVGKTSYLIGEVVNLMNNGYRVAWIDTEGGFNGVWGQWYNIYKKRMNATFDLEKQFIYKRVIGVEDFCKYMGIDMSVEYGDNKVSVTMTTSSKKAKDATEDTLINKYGKLRGKVAVIVDSFSAPIKLEFSSAVQNFSGRADAESIMMLSLFKFMEKTSAFTILTSHESRNPTDVYHPNGVMRGGATLKYFSKHILYYQKPQKKAWSNFRKVTAVRTPIAADWSRFAWFKIDDEGYHDETAETVESTL
ncbi:MAG: hypothetical protein QXL94_03510 [Candidatus Parvarchaeum sp.]